jgi:hypothetical protein
LLWRQYKKKRSCINSEDFSSALQYSSERVALVAILLSLRISQEQGVRKETKDNCGFETEHQERSGSNFSPTMLHRVMQNFQKRLGECVDKGRHFTDTIFRK